MRYDKSISLNAIADHVRSILSIIGGEDPERDGLKETPLRVAKAYHEMFSGYDQKPEDIMKQFDKESYDEMILLKNISFTSTCEHHMLPIMGTANIAYIPKDKIIGLSKLARLLDIYAKRLQVQERLTSQITQALMDGLDPLGAACVIEATHCCMICRGVLKQDCTMVTSSLKGVFLEKLEVREELFRLIGMKL